MMIKQIPILLVTLLLISSVVFADIDEKKIKSCFNANNMTCEYNKCAAVYFTVVNGENKPDNFVGDYFTYKITLINLGGNSVENDTFKVNISNPLQYSIGNRLFYPDKLKISDNQYLLHPTYRNRSNEYDIFPFDIAGAYTITLSSDTSMEYFRFYDNCRYTRSPNSLNYYFDVMPRWEKEWKDETENLQRDIIESNKQIKDSVGEMVTISKNMDKSGNYMFILTMIVGIFTLIQVYLQYCQKIIKNKRIKVIEPYLLVLLILIFIIVINILLNVDVLSMIIDFRNR